MSPWVIFAGRLSAAVEISAICSNVSELISGESKREEDTDLSETVLRNITDLFLTVHALHCQSVLKGPVCRLCFLSVSFGFRGEDALRMKTDKCTLS